MRLGSKIDYSDAIKQKAPSSNTGAPIDYFLFPLTRPLGLRGNLAQYEGHGGVTSGPPMKRVGAYSSPFAPSDPWGLGVLADARNRVGF